MDREASIPIFQFVLGSFMNYDVQVGSVYKQGESSRRRLLWVFIILNIVKIILIYQWLIVDADVCGEVPPVRQQIHNIYYGT